MSSAGSTAAIGPARRFWLAGVVALLLVAALGGAGRADAQAADPELGIQSSYVDAVANADGTVNVGDTVSVTVAAINDGNTPLDNVKVSTSLLAPATATCASVAVGASCVLLGTYNVSPADATNGQVVVHATVTSASPALANDDESNLFIPVATASGAAMLLVPGLNNYVDTDHGGTVTAGDTIDFVFTGLPVGNTGLSGFQIVTPVGVPGTSSCPAGVAPGGTCQLASTHTLTSAEASHLKVANATATATSTEVPGPEVISQGAAFAGQTIGMAYMEYASGLHQSGLSGATLATQLGVFVKSSTGAAVANQHVTFNAISNNGRVGTIDVLTDATGRASTPAILGNAPGIDVFIARLPSPAGYGPSFVFNETVLPAALKSVSVNPQTVFAGKTATGTVLLNAIAPPRGIIVDLASSNTAAATVPANVLVPAGASSASFNINAKPVTGSQTTTISAMYGGVTHTADLKVQALPPAPGLSIGDASIVKGSSGTKSMVFTIRLSKPFATAVTFNAATADGTAKAGVDYIATHVTAQTIPAGLISGRFSVPIIGDSRTGPDLAFSVNLSAVKVATLADAQAVGTIVSDTGPTLSVSSASITRGTSGTEPMTFTVTLSEPSPSAVKYTIATANGTALAGTDYVATSASQTLAAGQTSSTFPVSIIGHPGSGASVAFLINLSAATGATIAQGQGVGTILHASEPALSLSIADASVVRGTSGTASMIYTISLSKPSATAVTYNIATANDSAIAGTDYVATSLTGQTIPAGQISSTFAVPVIGNATNAPNVSFLVNVSAVVGSAVARNQAVGTIFSNGPTLSIADASGTKSQGKMTFTIALSRPSTNDVTFLPTATNGTAVAGTDFNFPIFFSMPVIPAGQTTYALVVDLIPVFGNPKVPNLTYYVNLTNASGASVTRDRAVGTILNTGGPTLSVGNASITKGTSGIESMLFTVTLSQPSTGAVTYNIATADGTAIADRDYVASHNIKPVSIPAGQTTSTFAVPIIGNSTVAADLTFFVNLSASTGATLFNSQAVGTIASP